MPGTTLGAEDTSVEKTHKSLCPHEKVVPGHLLITGPWAVFDGLGMKQVLVACLEESLLYFLGLVHRGGEHSIGGR